MAIDSKYLGLKSEEEARQTDCKVFLVDQTTLLWYGLPKGEHLVGRKGDYDKEGYVPIDSADEYLSRRSAYIRVERNIIGDMEANIRCYNEKGNPIFLNRNQVGADFALQLLNGDDIIMGETLFKIRFV